MSKIVKYSTILTKLKKKIHLPFKHLNTIIIDTDRIYDLNEEKYAKDLNNIVIGKNLIKEKYTDIRIKNTRTKNIYVEGLTNLGGITIPYDIINNNINMFITFSKNTDINKINILNISNKKNIPIILEKDLINIEVKKDNDELVIITKYKKKELDYRINKLGNVKVIKRNYVITEEDIYNGVLDITKLSEYENLNFSSILIDTLIINKDFIENIHKLTCLNHDRIIPFHNKLIFKRLRIIDDNKMLLIPFDRVFNNANSFNTYFRNGLKKYIYINDKENNILIYLDKNNNIKILEEKELLRNNDIENVVMNYSVNTFFLDNVPNLILIKYKNHYKIIDLENEFILKNDFFYLLSYDANKYFQENILYKALKEKDFITIYNSSEFTYNLFYRMYEDYLKFINYIDKLKKIGFNENAIKYLFEKNFNNIMNPNDNIIKDITNNEIEHFNEMGNEYIKIKRLEYEKE